MPTEQQLRVVEDSLRRCLRRQGALARFGTRALAARDIPALLQHAVEEVVRAVDAEYVKILEYRPASNDLLVRAGCGWKDGYVGRVTLPVNMRSPPGRALLTREPVRISDDKTNEFDIAPMLRDHGVISLVNVPIAWDDKVYGVLEIDTASFTEFMEDTVHFLLGYANLLAGAIHRADQEKERELLFRELQHRVKNNLQMIVMLLSLEEQKGEPGGLSHTKDAVKAIALAYEQLQKSDEIETVCLGSYVGQLCESYPPGLFGPHVQITYDLDKVHIDFNRAVLVGLIVNELMTNAAKHAFGPEGGTIMVTHRIEGDCGVLRVADDGRGIMEHSRPKSGDGSWLLPALADQVGGTLSRDDQHHPGTCHVLRFPLADPA